MAQHNDAPTPVDPQLFLELTTRRTSAVGLVTARVDGWDYAAVVSDYLFISYEPPSVLVSLYELSRIAEALEQAESWVLHVLSAQQEPIARRLAEPGAPLVGLLERIAHTRRVAEGPAWITGALATFECETLSTQQVATHQLFAGRVIAQAGAPDLSAALLRHRGAYRAID